MVFLASAEQPIVIKGKIENCPNRNYAHIQKYWFNPEHLQEENQRTDFTIAEDGTFYIKLKDTDDFYVKYWLHLGNEETHLELIAGDSINLTMDANRFDESIKYTGRGAGRNNYRRDVFLEFWETNSTSEVNTSDPSQFLSRLKSLTDRKLELLNKYYVSKEIDSSYYSYEKAQILNEMANLVLINNNNFHHHKNLPDSLSRKMAAILKTADFSDDHFLNYKEFRDLAAALPSYLLQLNSIKPGLDLKREIQYGRDHYTNTVQLYFFNDLIYKYLRQAQSLSERNVLLNFFDSQYDTPALKKIVQQHRYHRQRNQIVNSQIFQATLIIISSLVALLVVLFALIKLIQISANSSNSKRMKINLALWLKVIFYLVVSFTALVFISNNNAPLHGIPLVILVFGLFLTHTYVLIPQYAIKKDLHYGILLGVALVVFLGGNIISKQVSGSLFSILGLSDLFFGLVLLSWTSYFIHQLASRKSTLKDLIKNGDLNPELTFHLVTLFLINSIFVVNVRHGGGLSQVFLFYTILGLLYFHAFVSFPRFFNKEKVIQFIGINVIILLGASIAMIALDAFQSYHALKNIGVATKVSELISVRNIRLDLLVVFTLLLIPSFIYYFIKKQLMSNESTGFKLYRKKEAELAQLKSQVNPHFLFNTLNTLYAFALKEGSEKTAECIAKLANLMRFMLDDMEKDSILLKREISYIQDYVKLQSIRSAVEHDIAINVDLEDEEGCSIAPMLLIPFVENAFKHGMNPNEVSQLKIDVHAKSNQIQFVIENSVDENFQAYYKEKGFGIGIENVKSRLKHIYADRHILSIAKTNAKFIVILTIDLV
jgi:hypothetical protein